MGVFEELEVAMRDPDAPKEQLAAAYAELAELQGLLGAREGERRLRSEGTVRRLQRRRRGRA
jgi:hypothetical protein